MKERIRRLEVDEVLKGVSRDDRLLYRSKEHREALMLYAGLTLACYIKDHYRRVLHWTSDRDQFEREVLNPRIAKQIIAVRLGDKSKYDDTVHAVIYLGRHPYDGVRTIEIGQTIDSIGRCREHCFSTLHASISIKHYNEWAKNRQLEGLLLTYITCQEEDDYFPSLSEFIIETEGARNHLEDEVPLLCPPDTASSSAFYIIKQWLCRLKDAAPLSQDYEEIYRYLNHLGCSCTPMEN